MHRIALLVGLACGLAAGQLTTIWPAGTTDPQAIYVPGGWVQSPGCVEARLYGLGGGGEAVISLELAEQGCQPPSVCGRTCSPDNGSVYVFLFASLDARPPACAGEVCVDPIIPPSLVPQWHQVDGLFQAWAVVPGPFTSLVGTYAQIQSLWLIPDGTGWYAAVTSPVFSYQIG